MFTFYPLDMHPFSVNRFCYTGSHKHLHCKKKAVISKAGKSGYKDVTICSLGPWDFPVQLTKRYCNGCRVVSSNLVQNPVQYKSAAIINQSFIVHS